MRSLRSAILVATFLAGAASRVSTAVAGECVDRPEDYVATLEAGPSDDGFEYAVSCLGLNQVVEGRLWAGPIAAAGFRALRADPLRPRIARAVTALLATPWAASENSRRRLYLLAARRGIGTLDSVDVFTRLVPRQASDWMETYEAFAILADCRAVPVLAARYEALRSGGPGQYPDESLDVLSCLYHIPCREAVVVARRMLVGERDPKVRARLRRIIDRR
jgi:hypothetical protein